MLSAIVCEYALCLDKENFVLLMQWAVEIVDWAEEAQQLCKGDDE